MPNRSRRVKRTIKKANFIFTTDLNLIKPYAVYDICIENFISRFGPNDIILYNESIGFALIKYMDFCPINILDDPYCLDFIDINDYHRGTGYGKRLISFILQHFQTVIHALDSSLGFFEHISEDIGLEKINTGLHFGSGFISSSLIINRKPKVNTCIEGCGLKFKG